MVYTLDKPFFIGYGKDGQVHLFPWSVDGFGGRAEFYTLDAAREYMEHLRNDVWAVHLPDLGLDHDGSDLIQGMGLGIYRREAAIEKIE